MNLYYVTLNQGRSDNCYVWADSVTDIKSFFEAVSTANVTKIKKVVYSKEHLINATSVRAFSPVAYDKEIRAFVVTDNYQGIITLRHVKQNLTDEFIQEKMSQYLGFNNESINDYNTITRL